MAPFKFLWKLKLEHHPKRATTLTQPILLDRLIGFRGFKSIAFVGDRVRNGACVDIDFGVPLWKYHINYTRESATSRGCAAAMPGRPDGGAVETHGDRAVGAGGRWWRRRRGGRSGGGVGEPGKGATTLATAGPGRGAAAPAAPAAARSGRGARRRRRPPARNRLELPGARAVAGAVAAAVDRSSGGADAAYVVGSDGYLHALNVRTAGTT